MAIEDRNLKPGMKLVARYKKQDYTAEVVKTGDGLRFRLPDGSRELCNRTDQARVHDRIR